jgi:hypothetical protein
VQVGEDAYFVRADAAGVGDGVGGWARTSPRDAAASALFARRLMHHCAAELSALPPRPASPPLPAPKPVHTLFSPAVRAAQLHEELADELEELEDGLDVLAILESAYDKTIQAHVRPPPPDAPRLSPALPPEPWLAGSSTALLAVLDHTHVGPDAVLRIAHLGDSMGMLVRGERVVWRSAEQWSAWNTPVQLGPRSGTRPAAAACASVRVKADDVLVLATDGLSDNVWDEAVLAEVVRFRRAFLDQGGGVGRRALAGMLSEALCSLARRVADGAAPAGEVPFARRAREHGRAFAGGKADGELPVLDGWPGADAGCRYLGRRGGYFAVVTWVEVFVSSFRLCVFVCGGVHGPPGFGSLHLCLRMHPSIPTLFRCVCTSSPPHICIPSPAIR